MPPMQMEGDPMTEEQKWRAIWATWAITFAVVEAIALRSGHHHAPLTHHLRWCLGASRTKIGQGVLLGGAILLNRHLYNNKGTVICLTPPESGNS